ncbi:hypothetical protein CYMTET_25202 [Cymbomonas tetramitiformis]|uniref:Uncharacterized protein n=1 Tax=Cymbomonas tetramitiformis TaxID=36881 RepID=A0AAE0FU65_9CHLO|nr:hypothetical protein CYMTET_25202 [Cymbomonas tetramitiformis]
MPPKRSTLARRKLGKKLVAQRWAETPAIETPTVGNAAPRAAASAFSSQTETQTETPALLDDGAPLICSPVRTIAHDLDRVAPSQMPDSPDIVETEAAPALPFISKKVVSGVYRKLVQVKRLVLNRPQVCSLLTF